MLLAVVVLAALHVAGQESTWARARAAAAVVVVSLAPWMVLAIVQPDLLGFLSAMSSPLSSRTVWGPSTALAELLGRVTEGLGVAVAFPTLLTVVQLAAAVVGAAIVATLVVSARRRPVAQTIGLSLLVVVLLSPVVYPWYLAWGVLPLVAAGVNGRWLVRLSAFAPFTALPGCQYLVVFLPSDLATAAALAVSTVAAAVAALLVVRATREVAPAA
jgi:alpha-1,6-mannosyltransferase